MHRKFRIFKVQLLTIDQLHNMENFLEIILTGDFIRGADVVLKGAADSIGTHSRIEEMVTGGCFVVSVFLLFFHHFILSMGEATLVSVAALALFFPIFTEFCLVFGVIVFFGVLIVESPIQRVSII